MRRWRPGEFSVRVHPSTRTVKHSQTRSNAVKARPAHAGGLSGCSPPAIEMSCGVQWPAHCAATARWGVER